MDEKECLKRFKQGQKDIKTGFFSFKFTPDYLSGASNFTDAAKGYRQLMLFEKSLEAYNQAIICNKKLSDHFSAGNCYIQIGEIYLFELANFEKGADALKEASYCYKVSGKYSHSIKIYTDIALKMMENTNYEDAEKILKIAFDDCSEHLEDELIRISFEDVFDKLLDVQCGLGKYKEAIQMVETFIEKETAISGANKYKISKNYIKLAMLRIAVGEIYMVEGIIPRMYQVSYEDTAEDVADLKKLVDSIETLNKKDFTFCMTCAFTLFQNNLLKAVQKAYEKQEKIGPVQTKKTFTKSEDKIINIDPDEFMKVLPGNNNGNKNSNKENKEEDDDDDLR